MKKLSLLFILCMVSMLAFAQSNPPRDSVGGGMLGLSQQPADSVGGGMLGLSQQLPPGPASPLNGVGNDIQIGGAHTLYATYVKYNNTVTFKGTGYAQLDDASTVTCPEGGSCLIEFDQFVEVGGSGSDNPWAICSTLDGNLVSEPSCPWQGFVNFGGNYFWKSASGFQFAGGVSPGTHTVQTFIYSQDGVTVGIWALKYQVYQP